MCYSEQMHCQECEKCLTVGKLRVFRAREGVVSFDVCQSCYAQLTRKDALQYERSGLQYLTINGLVRGEQLIFHRSVHPKSRYRYEYLLRSERTGKDCSIQLPYAIDNVREFILALLPVLVAFAPNNQGRTRLPELRIAPYQTIFERIEPVLTLPLIGNIIALCEEK